MVYVGEYPCEYLLLGHAEMCVAIVGMGAVVDDAVEIEVQVVEFRDLVLLNELRCEGVALTVDLSMARGEEARLTRCSGRTTYPVSFEQTQVLSYVPWGYLEGSISTRCDMESREASVPIVQRA